MLIRLENYDLIPRQRRHVEFDSIKALLLYVKDTLTCRTITISCIGDPLIDADPRWILYLRSDQDFLRSVQADNGYCGICDGKIDPTGKMPQFNRNDRGGIDVQSGFIYCDYCGRTIGKMQSHTLIDLFHECVEGTNAEYKFTPLPIECGHCQGTGQVEIYDDVYPTGKYDACGSCLGTKYLKIDQDLMQL